MMAKELQDWFPEAQISDQPSRERGLSHSSFSFSTVDFAGGSWAQRAVKSSWLPF